MQELTVRQRQVLHVIQRSIAETGMPPTRAEIAQQLGFRSANAAEEHLRALQRKGCVQLLAGASRGIQLADALREEQGLPLIGRVAAGRPILAGLSRKSVIGRVLGLPEQQRLEGTTAVVSLAIAGGADIVRVHDVAAMTRVARMADAVVRGAPAEGQTWTGGPAA